MGDVRCLKRWFVGVYGGRMSAYRVRRVGVVNVVKKVVRQVRRLRRDWYFIFARRAGVRHNNWVYRGMYERGGIGELLGSYLCVMGGKLLLGGR